MRWRSQNGLRAVPVGGSAIEKGERMPAESAEHRKLVAEARDTYRTVAKRRASINWRRGPLQQQRQR